MFITLRHKSFTIL